MTDSASFGVGQRLNLLEGVKVVDVSRFLAGPFGTMVLGDLGADVLKVEPLDGDSTRGTPPYSFGGDSAYFLSINRNKRSLAIDFRSEEGREILGRLVADADIVVDNLRPAQRERIGLDFEQIKARSPRVISCSITGFGSTGPYRDRPAYDIIVQAISGVMGLTGPEGGPSVRTGVPIGDVVAGMYMVIGVLAALARRQTTGRGEHLDISMLDCQVSLLSYLAQYHLIGGVVPTHQGRAHVSIPTYNTFATRDGSEIVIAANTEAMWRSLCDVLGLSHLVDDPRFVTNADRLAHREELSPLLTESCGNRDRQELFAALVEAGVPAAPINAMDVALTDPQVVQREMVVSASHRNGDRFLTLGSPVKDDAARADDYISPPGLGEHTEGVLRDLGFTAEDIARLVASGVVGVQQ